MQGYIYIGYIVTNLKLKKASAKFNRRINKMSETLVIEAVSDKFKNKYSAGSIKANGKWMQVSSKLDLNDFRKDSQVIVELKTNDKGYTSVVGLVKESAIEAVEEAISQARVEAKTKTSKKTAEKETKPSYEDIKTRQIRVQGVTQSCISSPSLAGLPYTTILELADSIKLLAKEMIEFVEQESK